MIIVRFSNLSRISAFSIQDVPEKECWVFVLLTVMLSQASDLVVNDTEDAHCMTDPIRLGLGSAGILPPENVIDTRYYKYLAQAPFNPIDRLKEYCAHPGRRYHVDGVAVFGRNDCFARSPTGVVFASAVGTKPIETSAQCLNRFWPKSTR